MLLFIPKQCHLDRNNHELNNRTLKQLKNSTDGHLRSSGSMSSCPRCPWQFAKNYFIHYTHILLLSYATFARIYYGEVYSWLLGTLGTAKPICDYVDTNLAFPEFSKSTFAGSLVVEGQLKLCTVQQKGHQNNEC
jgi:hypothetical protein